MKTIALLLSTTVVLAAVVAATGFALDAAVLVSIGAACGIVGLFVRDYHRVHLRRRPGLADGIFAPPADVSREAKLRVQSLQSRKKTGRLYCRDSIRTKEAGREPTRLKSIPHALASQPRAYIKSITGGARAVSQPVNRIQIP